MAREGLREPAAKLMHPSTLLTLHILKSHLRSSPSTFGTLSSPLHLVRCMLRPLCLVRGWCLLVIGLSSKPLLVTTWPWAKAAGSISRATEKALPAHGLRRPSSREVPASCPATLGSLSAYNPFVPLREIQILKAGRPASLPDTPVLGQADLRLLHHKPRSTAAHTYT